MTDSEFVTVSELAKTLGISDRQAARYVSRVTDADRLVTDTGPTRVRLVTVITLREKTVRKPSTSIEPSRMTDTRQSDDSHMTVMRQTHDSHAAVITLREELAALKAERDGLRDRLTDTQTENTRLAEALSTSQRLTDQAQQLQLMTERRAAALESENEKLKALPAMEQPQERLFGSTPVETGVGVEDQSSGVARSFTKPQGSTGAPGGDSTGDRGQESAPKRHKRPWWPFGKTGD